MTNGTTIIISPRDRYSGLNDCIRNLYEYTNHEQFNLIILDLGYPESEIEKAKSQVADKDNAQIISYGRIIPIAALAKVRSMIRTRYVVLLDNDSRVTPQWLPPLIATAEAKSAAVIYPVTLERSGVDEGEDIRVHLFTTEFRVVDVDKTPYLIEEKSFRRARPEDLPDHPVESQAFELHCVMFRTDVLNEIELPEMTIREHLDIGLQLKSMDQKVYVEPRSHIIFDNLGSRAALGDLRFFNARWNSKITYSSSRLFEKRWGYRFYSEESIYNWAIRRRLFLILRWLYIPIPIANRVDSIFSAVKRRLFPIWDPLADPNGQSTPLFERLNGAAPPILDHAIRWTSVD